MGKRKKRTLILRCLCASCCCLFENNGYQRVCSAMTVRFQGVRPQRRERLHNGRWLHKLGNNSVWWAVTYALQH